MSEFNLSDKIEENDEDIMEEYGLHPDEKYWILTKDVKEFIRLESLEILKFFRGEISFEQLQLKRIELAGEKLK